PLGLAMAWKPVALGTIAAAVMRPGRVLPRPLPACALPSVAVRMLREPAELFLQRAAVLRTMDLADIVPGDQRVEVVLLGLLLEQGLQFGQLLRVFLREVHPLVEILVQIVQLPGVLVERLVPAGAAADEAVGIRQRRLPAIVVDRPRAEDVVMLGLAARR